MISDADIRRLGNLGITVPPMVSPVLEALLMEILAVPNPTISKSPPVGPGGIAGGPGFEGPRVSLPMGSLTSTSLNWSGAVCASRGRRFRSVFGRLRVPAQPSPPAQPREHRNYQCSMWVGMGGYRRWDSSLPQAGLMMGFRVGSNTPFLYGWQQWFLGTDADPYQAMDQFQVTWGDEVVLAVMVDPAGQAATSVFLNLTQANFAVAGMVSPRVMTGVTAEWIVERPSPWECLKKPYPLCNYGAVAFSACVAYDDPADVRTLTGARMVRMVERRGRPTGTRFISVPVRAPGNGISVRYRS